jgi:hypothetical protein
MPNGDLNNILIPAVAAHYKTASFSTSVAPTKVMVLAWLNEGMREMFLRLLPRRLVTGRMTAGRMDKLIRQTASEAETGASGFCELPNTGHTETAGISAYQAITIGGVPAAEVNLRDLDGGGATGTLAVSANDPIYAWGDNGTYNGIYYLPVAATAVVYYFVKFPTTLLDNGGAEEDWPMDDEMMVTVEHRAAASLYRSRPDQTSQAVAQIHQNFYEKKMQAYIGESYKIPSDTEV